MRAVLAESVSRLFYRNAINLGFPVFHANGIYQTVTHDEELLIDTEVWQARSTNGDWVLPLRPVSRVEQNIIAQRGLLPYLNSVKGDNG